MRNLLVLAAAFGLAIGANAQSSATVTQTGDTNDADVVQTGPNQTSTVQQINGDNNVADVTQFTNNNGPQTSSLLQDGNRNSAIVNMQQTGTGGTTINRATIEQVGDDNRVLSQSLNAPGYNSGQNAVVLQYGNGNTASQGVDRGYTQSLRAEQTGDGNTSTQQINGGAHNTVDTYQDGNRNIANQTVNGANWGYSSALARIDQDGDENEAAQTLGGGGFSDLNHASIVQNGFSNDATQTVTVTGGSSGVNDGNRALASQVGDNNEAVQTISGQLHDAKIYQTGNLNLAEQEMTAGATGAFAQFTQDGNSNIARLIQSGGDDFTLLQDGDGNILRGIGGAVASQTGASTALVNQIGNTNVVELQQSIGATATVNQTGNGNTSTVSQN